MRKSPLPFLPFQLRLVCCKIHPDWSYWFSFPYPKSSPSGGFVGLAAHPQGSMQGLCSFMCPCARLPLYRCVSGTSNYVCRYRGIELLLSCCAPQRAGRQLEVTALPGGGTGPQSQLCFPTRGDLSVQRSESCLTLLQSLCLSLRPATTFRSGSRAGLL